MKTPTRNEHGELVTVIGTIADGRGGRAAVRVIEFRFGERRTFALTGPHGGHADAARFSTQVRRAKSVWEHPSNAAEWYV